MKNLIIGKDRESDEQVGYSNADDRMNRIAALSANLLTLVAVSCASLGLWRVGTDLGWAGDFVVQNGLLSHWQVWIGASAIAQYARWRLARFAASAQRSEIEIAPVAEPSSVQSTTATI